MRLRKQDSLGDYILGRQNEFWINRPDLVAQLLLTRLKLKSGEWYANLDEGTPYEVFFTTKDYELINRLIDARMRQTEGLRDIKEYVAEINTRILSINSTVNTIFGDTSIKVDDLFISNSNNNNNNSNNNSTPTFKNNTLGSLNASGLNTKNFNEIFSDLQDSAKTIFGEDIILDPSTQDIQLISVFALALANTLDMILATYNSYSPITASGAALDNCVIINGLIRKLGTFSTVQLNLTGNPATHIINGYVLDKNEQKWNLPSSVMLNSSGLATITATADTMGPVTAIIGSINKIGTPTLGWDTVTNPVYAITGTNTETDAQLRARQRTSTTLSSTGPSQSLLGAVLQVEGVVNARVYDNFTNLTDENNIPAHSIALVVQDGNDNDIANVLYIKKSMGCGMFGNTSVPVTDPYGNTQNYLFQRPTLTNIYISVHIETLLGYDLSTDDVIKSNLLKYIQSVPIGSNIYVNNISVIVENSDINKTHPTFEVMETSIGLSSSTQDMISSGKLTLGWDVKAQIQISNISININT